MTFRNRSPKLLIKPCSNDKNLHTPPVNSGIFSWYTRLTNNVKRKQTYFVYKTSKKNDSVVFE